MPVSSFPITEDTAATLQQFAVFTFGGRLYQGIVLNDPDTGDSVQVNSDGSLGVRLSDGTDSLVINTDGSLISRISDGTDTLGVNADGSLVVRLSDGTDTLLVNADGSINVAFAVGAEVKITDGTDDLAINADGSIGVRVSDGTDSLGVNADGSVVARISDGADTLLVNADGSIGTRISDGTDSLGINSDGSLVVRLSDGTDTALVDATGHLLVAGTFTPAKGAKTFSANAPTVAAALALAANASRITALIQNTGAVDVWLGKDGTLTTSNGFYLRAGDIYSDGDSTDAWWAITAGSTAALRIIEVA